MSSPAFSGNFSPTTVDSQKGANEFQVPLNAFDPKKQVVGEKDSNRLFMPGRVRKYIPTLYKQVWLNSRAILSVNGYELVNNEPTGETSEAGVVIKADTVTSDIRTSVLRSDGGDFEATTVALRENEAGMTKVVISAGKNKDLTARTLKCDTSARFLVHDGEMYDTYVFTETGGHISYVQSTWLDKPEDYAGEVKTAYLVLNYEGFFMNSTAAGASTYAIPDLNQPGTASPPAETPAAPAETPAE